MRADPLLVKPRGTWLAAIQQVGLFAGCQRDARVHTVHQRTAVSGAEYDDLHVVYSLKSVARSATWILSDGSAQYTAKSWCRHH